MLHMPRPHVSRFWAFVTAPPLDCTWDDMWLALTKRIQQRWRWSVPGLGLKKIQQLLLLCSQKPGYLAGEREAMGKVRGCCNHVEITKEPRQQWELGPRRWPSVHSHSSQPPSLLGHPSWVFRYWVKRPSWCFSPSWHHTEERCAIPVVLYPNSWPTALWEIIKWWLFLSHSILQKSIL